MINRYSLTDDDATLLHDGLQSLHDELEQLADNRDFATVNIWYILHRIEKLQFGVIWGFAKENTDLPFQ